jgi:hypothetical protein
LVATVAASSSSSMLLPLVLGIALGLSLMIVGVALTPARAMRKGSVAAVVEDRRESLLYTGVAVALGIGLGLVIALGAS